MSDNEPRQQQGLNASLKKAFIQPFRSTKPKHPSKKRQVQPIKLSELNTYQYSPLDTSTKSLRLLEVLPGPDYEPIKGRIVHSSLDTNPNYIALSYTWDHGGDVKEIECEGTIIKVGQNLWSFLHQYRNKHSTLQYHEKETPVPPPLWIDALCIDQQNFEERASQVAQMRDTYTIASEVIVWLGPAQADEELAFLLTRYPSLLHVDEMSGALINLLNKSYWSRVWVVQEFVLAKTVQIWCGPFYAEASAFENLWRHEDTMTAYSSFSQSLSYTHGWTLFKYRRDFRHSRVFKRELLGRRNSKSLKSTFRLRDLLQSFATSESSEVYDKVYGFLGIASKGRIDQPIRPDYKKPPVELLIDVLHNQCHNTVRKAQEDNYKFLLFLMRTLKVSRMELARHILHHAAEVEKHIYVLTTSEFMSASVSVVSTIMDIGTFVEHAEAFQESTWKTAWKNVFARSSMHPKSLSNTDIQELRPVALSTDSALVLSFADHHIKDAMYLGKHEELRQDVINDSTEIVIQTLLQRYGEAQLDQRVGHVPISHARLRQTFFKSLNHSMKLHVTAREARHGSEPSIRYERYATFTGTNGIIGLACIGGEAGAREVMNGDRVCIFSDVTESSNAFIVRLDSEGDWIITGFAIILYPAATEEQSPPLSPRLIQRVDTEATMYDDDPFGQFGGRYEKKMCFHCHLTDLLELTRCGILSPAQMEQLLENSLRGDPDDEVHRCSLGTGEHDSLEFGLLT